jgi:cephalosporin hydroxylase
MANDAVAAFAAEVQSNIRRMAGDRDLQELSRAWIRDSSGPHYTYNFRWMGRPIIQFPQDIVALQELVWEIKPDLIVETGIAHGGSLIFFASMLELLGGNGLMVGIDVDIRAHNRAAIEAHPMFRRIKMIEGSSVDPEVIAQVTKLASGRKRVMVVLDSNHTHDHVRRELDAYSPLVRSGSYLVVLDTIIEDMPVTLYPDRPWGPGNNPKTAVRDFLAVNDRFRVEADIEHKLLITVAPGGYLKCVRDP